MKIRHVVHFIPGRITLQWYHHKLVCDDDDDYTGPTSEFCRVCNRLVLRGWGRWWDDDAWSYVIRETLRAQRAETIRRRYVARFTE